MNRYYNENPQIILLKEENEKLKKKVVWYDDKVSELIHEVNLQAERSKQIYNLSQEAKDEMYAVREMMDAKMKDFNRLPWYKKMFYKFDV